jgi:Ycf66 protein N-terminus
MLPDRSALKSLEANIVGTGLNTPALLFGIILLVASIGLFFWGRLKPELARDSDNVYSVIGIICSVILFTSAFDLSLILGFQQLLLIGSVIVLMWENIQKRTPNPDGPKRSFSANGRDDDRGGSRRNAYRAERAPEYDEFPPQSRGNAGLRGDYPEPGYGNDPGYGDRALPRRDADSRSGGGRRDRPNRSSRFEENDAPIGRNESFGDEPRQIPSRSGNSRPDDRMNDADRGPRPSDAPRRRQPDDTAPPRRRPRPDRIEDINSNMNEDIPSADYVDFTPIESTDRPASNSWGPNG